MRSKWDWVGAITGVLGVVLGIVAVVISGEPPGADEGSAKVVEWYVDNKDEVQIASGLGMLATLLLIFFFGYLRRVLRQAEGEGGTLSVVALLGMGIIGVGLAFDTTLSFAISEAADDKVDPTAILAMQAIWDNDFFPIALGAAVVLWAVGISVIRHRALPLWLGIVALVFAVVAITPLGFIGVLGLLLWILVTSILLTMRAAKARSAPAGTTATTTV